MLKVEFRMGNSSTFHLAGKLCISGVPLLGVLLQCFRLISIHPR
jgi:hypothetical protein